MKKMIILSVVAVTVIFLGMNLPSSARISENANSALNIHYQVYVHPDWNITHTTCPLNVVITDGQGMAIGEPQPYKAGHNMYHFYESGPVTGLRTARLINGQIADGDAVCMVISLLNSKSGTFSNGETYTYDLYWKSVFSPATD